jgi:threonine synthase
MSRWRGLLEEYKEYLPLEKASARVTLLEGDTPLVSAPRLSERTGLTVLLKVEGANPTGSFKDRGMTYAISRAKASGSTAIVCASTGNTSASAAAYAARGGLKAFVVVPKGKIALGKLLQAMIHGAKVLQIQGNFDDALEMVREIAERKGHTLVNSLNQDRIDGQMTGAFEVVDFLGRAPDYHFLPTGNAGNITAYWKGYRVYEKAGKLKALPKMMGWQAAGAAPIVDGKRVERPETIATAIQIGNPARWKQAEQARDESGGVIDKITDEEIKQAYLFVAAHEGVFCEPASAAGIAGLLKLSAAGKLQKGATAVVTLTGNGLKDPDFGLKHLPGPVTVKPEIGAVLEALEK